VSEENKASDYEDEGLRRTAPRVTIPDPEITNEKKFRCPIDQQVYDNREDYEAHCHEEHDVL
jgi:uncharacterized C2H2 Zn-finger protein